jgi:hypothetical protein
VDGRDKPGHDDGGQIAAGLPAPANQVPSIGCSIKWKAGRG